MSAAEDAARRKTLEWIKAGEEKDDVNEGDLCTFEDAVWFGVWCQVGGESVEEPDVLFRTEAEANAYMVLMREPYDWHIGPVVLEIKFRDRDEPKEAHS